MRLKMVVAAALAAGALVTGAGAADAITYHGSLLGVHDEVLNNDTAQKVHRLATAWREGKLTAKQAIRQCHAIGDPSSDIICWDMITQALAEQHVSPPVAKRWMNETRDIWYHANSGDGFGPTVPLPPTCMRLAGVRC